MFSLRLLRNLQNFVVHLQLCFDTSSLNRNISIKKFVKIKENCIKRFSVNISTRLCTYVCFVCSGLFGLFFCAVGKSGYIASNARMVDDWERTWKEATVVLSMRCRGIFLGSQEDHERQ
jgi:hypothetical protein